MYFIHEHFILKTRGDREEVTDSRRREGGKRQRGRRERRGMGKKVREHHDYSSGRYTRSLGDIQPHTHTLTYTHTHTHLYIRHTLMLHTHTLIYTQARWACED